MVQEMLLGAFGNGISGVTDVREALDKASLTYQATTHHFLSFSPRCLARLSTCNIQEP